VATTISAEQAWSIGMVGGLSPWMRPASVLLVDRNPHATRTFVVTLNSEAIPLDGIRGKHHRMVLNSIVSMSGHGGALFQDQAVPEFQAIERVGTAYKNCSTSTPPESWRISAFLPGKPPGGAQGTIESVKSALGSRTVEGICFAGRRRGHES